MNSRQWEAYRQLERAGVTLERPNSIRWNAGGESETIKHIVGKVLVGTVGLRNDYRVNSEVEVEDGEIDVLLFGNPDRLTYAVELETSPTDETIRSKIERYVTPYPIQDIQVLNLNDMPMDIVDAYAWVADVLGLDP